MSGEGLVATGANGSKRPAALPKHAGDSGYARAGDSVHGVHPMERLRHLARASEADQRLLVAETAAALVAMRHDIAASPGGLVVAARRIVERQPLSGPLWALCAHAVTAIEPFAAIDRFAAEVEYDDTPGRLADAIPADATVVVLGWPDLAGDALLQRGDVRVLAVDARDDGSSFVRRLRRADVDAEVVPPAGLAAAVLSADLVLVEALAAGVDEVVATVGSRAAASVAWCSDVPAWLVIGRGRRLADRLYTALASGLRSERAPWDAVAEAVPTGLFAAAVDAADDACPPAPELLRHSAM